MPTYGYRCDACGGEFDAVQRMSDEPVASCPSCGAASRRLFFPAGIVFRGSGFYKTDSRDRSASSPPAKPAATGGAGGSAGGGSAGGGSAGGGSAGGGSAAPPAASASSSDPTRRSTEASGDR